MKYLTEARIDFASAARIGLHDTYDWHQAVWQAFPGRDGDPRDFLTRLDRQENGFRLWILSPAEPARPDWCGEDPASWETKEIPEGYSSYDHYRFQLRANPTKKVRVGSLEEGTRKKNGRRVALRKHEELAGWIHRKAEAGGFAVEPDTLRIVPEGREDFAKPARRGMHSSVDFRGVLRVTVPQRFYETFCRGVGSAKAFGFGMLVLAPIRS